MAGEVHRLIALSLGKIALSRQQRGGINLHKNLLVASVLHKARTTYMMDNFQTLIANRKAQAEREAASKMVVEAPIIEVSENFNDAEVEQSDSVDDQVVPSNGVTDYESRVNGEEAPSGDEESDYIKSDSSSRCGKENLSPSDEEMYVPASSCKLDSSEPLTHTVNKRSFSVLDTPVIVTGKQPLLEHNENIDNGNNQLPSCRCAGAKRRRSCLDSSDLVSQAKRARLSEGYDSCESDSEIDYDSSSESHDYVNMQTETTQVTSLVDIFSTGFSGLYKETESSSDNSNGHTGGQINVYVSADHPLAGTQFVLKDVSCATQIKDNVAIPTPIALAV